VPLPKTFLDTNIAQAIMIFGEFIYDRVPSDRVDGLGDRLAEDIHALQDLAQLGTWYGWPIVVSAGVKDEHAAAGPSRRIRLLGWDDEVQASWTEWFPQDRVLSSSPLHWVHLHRALDANEPWLRSMFNRFPGTADKRLLVDAICLGCDVFLTMDYRTIWSPSKHGPSLPLRIMRPSELLDEVARAYSPLGYCCH
jgi:hypothetical protein